MGLNMGWMRINPFAGIQYRQQENDPTFLTLEEVKTIAGMEFPVARLNIVRDMFLFSCFTGLAFIDAKELKRTEIIKDNICRLPLTHQRLIAPGRILRGGS